jgi:tetrahydromethanopterin S-methyltransferase subunit G
MFLTGLTTPLLAQDTSASQPIPVAPQTPLAGSEVVSSEYAISGSEALLRLELAGGRRFELSTRDGSAYVDGSRVGAAPRGDTLDREWRELLTQAMDAQPEQLPAMLRAWSPSGDAGAQMKTAILNALDQAQTAVTTMTPAIPAPLSDSMSRLANRIDELEERLAERRFDEANYRREFGGGFFDNVGEGLGAIFGMIIGGLVICGIGFLLVFFGGRKYLEGVSDTVRNATGRSFLTGVAAAFLFFPAWVLGALLLTISIVGIPGLIAWVPGLPVAMCLALLLGFLAVANAAGESFAERRLYVSKWFRRGNVLYNMLAGIFLLFTLFFAAFIVHMAGGWIEPLEVLLYVLGGVVIFIAFLTGLGAVLLSRAGTRPATARVEREPDLFAATEEASV